TRSVVSRCGGQGLEGAFTTQHDLAGNHVRTITVRRKWRICILTLLIGNRNLKRVLLSVVGVERHRCARNLVCFSTRCPQVSFGKPTFTTEDVVLVGLLSHRNRREKCSARKTFSWPTNRNVGE